MTATNPYGKTPDEQSFARAGALIVPSNSDELTTVSKGLFVLAAGTVKFVPAESIEALTTGTLAAGTIIPYLVKQVFATGTSATVASLDE